MALYYLAVNPKVQEKAAAEALKLAEQSADDQGRISGEDVNQLKYIDQVLNETLRMAAIPTFSRSAQVF